MSSESDFAYSRKYNTHFIVQNTSSTLRKTIKIFNYPINFGGSRDLLQIPGIEEEDIRASLLKGVLRHKFLCGDIQLISSNVDLLQFSSKQQAFLHQFGFDTGVQIQAMQVGDGALAYIDGYIKSQGLTGINYLLKNKIVLIGNKNNSNRTFYTPDKFINGSYFNNVFIISVEHNGRQLYENIDFTISESSGVGTGYDTINLISLTPTPQSQLFCSYATIT